MNLNKSTRVKVKYISPKNRESDKDRDTKACLVLHQFSASAVSPVVVGRPDDVISLVC